MSASSEVGPEVKAVVGREAPIPHGKNGSAKQVHISSLDVREHGPSNLGSSGVRPLEKVNVVDDEGLVREVAHQP